MTQWQDYDAGYSGGAHREDWDPPLQALLGETRVAIRAPGPIWGK